MWDWTYVIVVLMVGGWIRRKDSEKFKKIMSDALSYIMSIGILLCFLELLGRYDIQILGTSFDFAWNLGPMEIMGAICSLFLASFAINSWKRSISKSDDEHVAKCKKTTA